MSAFIGAIAVGAICIVLGIRNMRGNISSLHSYHRHRVAEENRIPFGKKVGLGTIICGVSLMAFGAFYVLAEKTGNQALTLAGTVTLIVGLVIGLGLAFLAMIKYNKGIF